MQLHPNAKDQMLAHLNEDLEHIIVENGMFIERVSAFLGLFRANNVLPKQGDVAQSLQAWIGDLPIVEFFSDSLSEELSLYGKYVGGEDKRSITQIAGYEDVGALAERLVASFESLPWRYMLTLELDPSLFPPLPGDATSLCFGEETELVKSSFLMADGFPLASNDEAIEKRMKGPGILALLQEGPLHWNEEAPYFQTEIEGFVGHYGGGTPLDVATSRLKAFFGLGLGMGLFAHESRYEPSPPKKQWVVHRFENDKWAVWNRLSLDDEDARVLQGLKPWDRFGINYPEDQKVPWLQSVLTQMSRAISRPHSGTLRLASQWFWDSHKGADEVLRYVRRMTSLEILLGDGADTSNTSLGELLGNRLAYLIGKTHKERSDVMADFKKIYNVRSKILHRGKHRLVGDERMMMARLQSLCERALKEEAKIIAAPE